MSEQLEGAGLQSLEVLRLLPHRYPFLLVDRILEFTPGQELRAIKNVTLNEPFFQGHFPEYPVMPGVLIIEALAQAGGLLVLKSQQNLPQDRIFMFSGIEKVRFRKPVYPGDQLMLFVSYLKQRMNLWKMQAEASVGQNLAVQGVLTAALAPRQEES
ncbi:MAG: 3-hydroxyacyl-ACP dehydratase FabZ [Desulfohalobiaceae bacterium]